MCFTVFLLQTVDLSAVFKDSAPNIPLIFVLSQGTDPAVDLYKFAEDMRFSKKLTAISLGQGQVCGSAALKMYLRHVQISFLFSCRVLAPRR